MRTAITVTSRRRHRAVGPTLDNTGQVLGPAGVGCPIRRIPRSRLARGAVALSLSGALSAPQGGCVFFKDIDVTPVERRDGVEVRTTVKAHLKDGSTVVYANGVTVTKDALLGAGRGYNLKLEETGVVQAVPLNSVVAMESFRQTWDPAGDTTLSVLGTAGAVVGAIFAGFAIFGSCPTVYSETPAGPALDAELFSYSIAPLLEGRDLDRLRLKPGSDGTLRLEIRNEALETHYINHLQLLEVRHGSDEVVVPDQEGRPVVLGEVRPVSAASDRGGRDLRPVLAADDERVFRTAPAVLAAASAADLEDWIDATVEVPDGANRIALLFRLRNSLLNTVLFYDEILARSGAHSLDWVGGDLERISTAVELGRWYTRRMGLRVLLWRNGRYESVARIPDAGPIAWRDVAAIIPVPSGERTLRLRLSFVADAWRIDRLRVASAVRQATARTIPLAAVTGPTGRAEEEALASLREPDARYLQTSPGQRFIARFDVGPEAGGSRTLLLSSQGYYVEWVRQHWLRPGGSVRPFRPSDEALAAALDTWRRTQASFEKRFESSRIPVR